MNLIRLTAWLICFPIVVSACPVCFDAKEGTRQAFAWTTVMLSSVPLAMIFSAVYFLRRRIIQHEQSLTAEIR